MDLKEVGVIVGAATPQSFYMSCPKGAPPRWEYVAFRSREAVGWEDETEEVLVIAQVEEPVNESLVLKQTTDPDAIRKITEMRADNPVSYARIRVFGYYDPKLNCVRMPRMAPAPGESVYLAPDEALRKIYCYDKNEGIEVGSLLIRRLPAHFSLNGFRRHVAILAATGAGKSYAAGLMIERLLEKGATVLVIDPHADYVRLGLSNQGRLEWADRVVLLKTPGSTFDYRGMAPATEPKEFVVSLRDLGVENLCSLIGVRRDWKKIRGVIERAWKELGDDLTKRRLVERIESISMGEGKDAKNAGRAYAYVKQLEEFAVIGDKTIRASKFLKPGHVVVLDLSGLPDTEIEAATWLVLKEVFYERIKAERGLEGAIDFPAFVFIEEAHKIAPKERNPICKGIVTKIAREGRKFGVFLIIISQRPSDLDPDVLGMCQSTIAMRIINPEDQSAIRKSAEKMSEDLLEDLPGLNIGEAVVVGELVKAPAIIRFGGRRSLEGGSDIDVVKRLEEARQRMDDMKRDAYTPKEGEDVYR